MKELSNVTLVIVDTLTPAKALVSLRKSLEQIKPAKTLLLTHVYLDAGPNIEVVKIAPLNSKKEYSEFIIKELYKYFSTDFVLVTQHDGWVLDGDAWEDEFYDYDYIGAPWIYEHGRNVGNGGFSLRSKRLQEILAAEELIDVTHPEDQSIGIIYRNLLEEKYGLQFPSEELADKFAFELKTPAQPTFGFHGYFHRPFQKTVWIKRDGAMGDVIQIEPLLHHFYKKGYRVVLETLPQFNNLFLQHYFKVHRPDEIDRRLLASTEVYDLNMSYESKPQQLHLKSYFEFCGIPEHEMELRNPVLSLHFLNKNTKLFDKYVVLHIDRRPQEGRQIQGSIHWGRVVSHLNDMGYTVIQIGLGDHEEAPGAVQMRTPTEPFMMWVIGGADGFIGIDSGPANIAVSFGLPAAIFFGSVNPAYIYADLSKIQVITNHPEMGEPICSNVYCWSSVVGCEGVKCVVNEKKPPCVQFTTKQVISTIIDMKLHIHNQLS